MDRRRSTGAKRTLNALSRSPLLTATLAAAIALPAVAAAAEPVEETLDHATFGRVAIYLATDEPKGVALFASGIGGWHPELARAAQDLAQLDYVVAGIDLDAYLARLDRADAPCADLSADLAQLNLALEQRYPITTHQPPVLLGQSAGAALAYAALAQAPDDRFHAGVTVDFCPELPLRKPLCKGPANLDSAPLLDAKGQALKPVGRMPATWFAFQNRPACEPAAVKRFIGSIRLARLTEIPGTDGAKAWLPQVSALMRWLDPGIAKQVQPDADIGDIPLTEAPATGGPDRPQLAVMLSGDGGWALLDRAVAAELAKNGLPTVGWDSLGYFWKARQPDEAASDLERVLRHYLSAWQKQRIVLIGYSFGADALPALVNRLPRDLHDRVELAVFLGLSDAAAFQFHLTDWIGGQPPKRDHPVRPELERLAGIKRLCVYGADEADAACPKLVDVGLIADQMPGDHHFDEDYPGVARRILDRLPPLPATASQPPAKN